MIDRLFLLGFDHTITPRAVRERISAVPLSSGGLLRALPRPAAPSGLALLATCHRTEVYGAAERPAQAVAELLTHLANLADIPRDELASGTRVAHGAMAARHLFEVAAGMHSVVRGESQILGQIKDSLHESIDSDASDAVVASLFRHAIEAGKRVRTEAPLGLANASLADLALSLMPAADELAHAEPAPVVVGSGRMASLVIQRLYRAGVRSLTVISADPNAAERLSRSGHIRLTVRPPQDLSTAITESDYVLFCNRSPRPLLYQEDIDQAHLRRSKRGARRLTLVDLAHPRAVDAHRVPLGVQLVNLQSLEAASGQQVLLDRRAPKAGELIAHHVDAFVTWCFERNASKEITRVRRHIQEAADAELQALLAKLGDADDADRKSVV